MSKNPSDVAPEKQPPADPGAADDPLASLFKMSPTAGLGSQEYVAVSATAVVALLLGLLSSATVLSAFLLVIPAVTIVVAIIAIMQIRRSAGTLTGAWLAWVGMLLAIGFVARVGGRELMHARQVQAEKDQILQLIDRFGQDLSKEKYEAAYDLFSGRFKERVTKENFIGLWNRLAATPGWKVKDVRSNGFIDVEIDQETGTMLGFGPLLIELENGGVDRRPQATQFRKDNDQWTIDNIPIDFTPPTAARPQSGG